MKDQILKLLEENEVVEMESNDDSLIIWFRVFFGSRKEFHFQLNGVPVDGCKTNSTALKKINRFISRGFLLCE
jgi:hypothetical protein